MSGRAYIARYSLNEEKNNLIEKILMEDAFVSQRLLDEFDRLAKVRKPNEPMLQLWYYNKYQVELCAWTNQPYKLD